ncbi:hydrolase [Streptosporangium violaceochromogenes]|nr:hydrolase [Streptosporangium violaceochromogenes]
MDPCVFCQIIAREAPAAVVREWDDALAFAPLGPVVPGHLLVIPKQHVTDVAEDPAVSAAAMRAASELATPPCNIITSAGREATQTVFHLHLHIVPRRDGDGLALPWYSSRLVLPGGAA